MYLYYIKIKILESLTYKYEFYLTVAKQFFFILITAVFWRALYQHSPDAGGVSVNDMLIYSVISVFLQNFYSKSVENEIKSRIRNGSIAIDYLKPINLFGMFFANDVGNIVVNLIQRFIPVLLFSMIFIIMPVPASLWMLILFIVSAMMGFFILWNIAAIFGLLYFWLTDTGNIGGIKDYVIGILSGAVIPVWFFPAGLQEALKFLPFIYTYQLPISIFIGKIRPSEALYSMAVQLIWCVVFFILFNVISKRAVKNIMIQGG